MQLRALPVEAAVLLVTYLEGSLYLRHCRMACRDPGDRRLPGATPRLLQALVWPKPGQARRSP